MSFEPGTVDTNVLVYAFDADHSHHPASRALLEAARARAATLYVTSQILCEFYSIVTNPRRVPRPRPPADALAAISSLLAFVRILPSPARSVTVLMELLRRHPVTAGDIFDLQIVATMHTSIRRIYTFHADDFQVFPELIVVVPGA